MAAPRPRHRLRRYHVRCRTPRPTRRPRLPALAELLSGRRRGSGRRRTRPRGGSVAWLGAGSRSGSPRAALRIDLRARGWAEEDERGCSRPTTVARRVRRPRCAFCKFAAAAWSNVASRVGRCNRWMNFAPRAAPRRRRVPCRDCLSWPVMSGSLRRAGYRRRQPTARARVRRRRTMYDRARRTKAFRGVGVGDLDGELALERHDDLDDVSDNAADAAEPGQEVGRADVGADLGEGLEAAKARSTHLGGRVAKPRSARGAIFRGAAVMRWARACKRLLALIAYRCRDESRCAWAGVGDGAHAAASRSALPSQLPQRRRTSSERRRRAAARAASDDAGASCSWRRRAGRRAR